MGFTGFGVGWVAVGLGSVGHACCARPSPCALECPQFGIPTLGFGRAGRSCIGGSQAMVLSHSRAPIEERMPHHGIRSVPVRPVIFMGRSAHVEPNIEVMMAMHAFYRDTRIKR